MSKILIIDDAPFCRELVSEALRAKGYQTVTEADGTAGLASLRQSRADLVILDMDMPRMGGLDFLQRLRAEPAWHDMPVFMLTGTTRKDSILAAKRLGATEYLLKAHFSLDELLARIGKRMGPADPPAAPKEAAVQPAPPMACETTPEIPAAPAAPSPDRPARIERNATLLALDNVGTSKVLPGAIAEVMAVAAQPRSNMAELARAVKQDPVLSARVLQAANAAALVTTKRHLTTVEDAVRNLGASSVRELAVGIGVLDVLGAHAGELLRCWQHALAAATLMDRIVPRTDAPDCGAAYLVGLCHDLDEIVLRQNFPREYAASVSYAARSGEALGSVLAHTFGMPRAELVHELLSRMKLPAQIIDPIIAHAVGGAEPAQVSASALTLSLRIADYCANALQMTNSPDALIAPVSQAECGSALIAGVSIDAAEIRSSVTSTICALSKAGSAQRDQLLAPLFNKTNTRVWYARRSSLASPDPMEIALGMLCETQTHNRLPESAGEFDTLDALVVIAPQPTASGFTSVEVGACRATTRKDMPVLHLAAAGQTQEPAMILPVSLSALACFAANAQR